MFSGPWVHGGITAILLDKATGLQGAWGQAAPTKCPSGPVRGASVLPPRPAHMLQAVQLFPIPGVEAAVRRVCAEILP